MNSLKRNFIIFALAICLVPLVTLSATSPVVQVRNGYVRGLPPGTANTSAYMTLVNNSDEELVLTGATTPAAQSVSIHRSVKRPGGVLAMEHVMAATLPARANLELKSGGMHLMLMGLKRPLRDGNTVKLTLQFGGGFSRTMDLPVVSVLNE